MERSAKTSVTLFAALAGFGCGVLFRTPSLALHASKVLAVTGPLAAIFLRGLFMLVLPLLFTSLVLGVSELSLGGLGRLGRKLLGYTVVVSAIAVGIGVGLVELVQPGAGIPHADLPKAAAVLTQKAPSATELLVKMVPENVVRAAADGDMLAVIFFALVFGVALSATGSDESRVLREVLQGILDVSMKLVAWVLRLLPLGVFCLLFQLGTKLGWSMLASLGAYVGVVLAALALHQFGIYSLALWLFSRKNPLAFFREVRPAMLTAFSTASSAASLPSALHVAEEHLKLPRHVSRFVLTAGSAMNQNGTALFEGVTVLFLAQAYGVTLTLPEEFTVIGICILGGIGTAGVPAGSLPVIAMILEMYGIPREGLGLVLGVDRLLDMCRTVLNVTGDLAAAVFVAGREPTFPDFSED